MCKNKSILILIFLVFGTSIFAQTKKSENDLSWTFHQLDDLACSLNAPGEKNEKEISVTTELGDIFQQVRFWKDDTSVTENYLYSLTSYEYPMGTFHTDSTNLIAALFDEIINSSTEAFEGEILYEDERSEWGHPAKIWKMKFKDDRAFVKSKVVLVGDRCYCLQVFMLNDYQTNRNADRFLNSFKLI